MSDDTQQVTRLLADLRYPPIPEHLADRVGSAIAAEAAIRAGREATSPAVVSPASGRALVLQAAKARAESKVLHEDVRKLAEVLGETEHAVSRTMDKLAAHHPVHAEFLGEMSRAAKLGAAQAAAMG